MFNIIMMFTLSREFATTSFSKCNRLFLVHFPGVEAERRDAFPLKSERTRKKLIKNLTPDLLHNLFGVI